MEIKTHRPQAPSMTLLGKWLALWTRAHSNLNRNSMPYENNSTRPAATTASVNGSTKSEYEGLWALIANIMSGSHKLHALDKDIQTTNALRQSCKQLQAPLLAQLKDMAQQSDKIAGQSDDNNRALQAQEKGQLDQITAQFKLSSASFIPLTKELTLLDLDGRTLRGWGTALPPRTAPDLR